MAACVVSMTAGIGCLNHGPLFTPANSGKIPEEFRCAIETFLNFGH
jgi:hypothetical protein